MKIVIEFLTQEFELEITNVDLGRYNDELQDFDIKSAKCITCKDIYVDSRMKEIMKGMILEPKNIHYDEVRDKIMEERLIDIRSYQIDRVYDEMRGN